MDAKTMLLIAADIRAVRKKLVARIDDEKFSEITAAQKSLDLAATSLAEFDKT